MPPRHQDTKFHKGENHLLLTTNYLSHSLNYEAPPITDYLITDYRLLLNGDLLRQPHRIESDHEFFRIMEYQNLYTKQKAERNNRRTFDFFCRAHFRLAYPAAQ